MTRLLSCVRADRRECTKLYERFPRSPMTDQPTRKSPDHVAESPVEGGARVSRYRLKDGSWVLRHVNEVGESAPLRPERPEFVMDEDGVTITGTEHDIEDFLDSREIDRRMADPEANQRIPWDQVKANLGL